MASLPLDTWIRLVVWLAIGMFIYFGYGRHHSRVQKLVADEVKVAGD
jgi:APA family basic amino acid/polyamine antiporter